MNTSNSSRRGRWAALLLVPLVAFGVVLLWPQQGEAQTAEMQSASASTTTETERALFPICAGPRRVTCVVDGDTIWYQGTKIRIADIDSPEITRPGCPRERQLGERATERLRELLNAGSFSLDIPPDGRAEDRYGRALRIVTRNGESLGEVLVREGLAARWGGPRRAWCGAGDLRS